METVKYDKVFIEGLIMILMYYEQKCLESIHQVPEPGIYGKRRYTIEDILEGLKQLKDLWGSIRAYKNILKRYRILILEGDLDKDLLDHILPMMNGQIDNAISFTFETCPESFGLRYLK